MMRRPLCLNILSLKKALQEVTKRVAAHFDIFQKISQTAQDQIKATLKQFSREIAEIAAEELAEKVENQVQDALRDLEQSIQNAKRDLEGLSIRNKGKLILIFLLGIGLTALGGFIGGYFYHQKKSPYSSKEILNAYQLGLQKTASNQIPQSKKKPGKNMSNKLRKEL